MERTKKTKEEVEETIKSTKTEEVVKETPPVDDGKIWWKKTGGGIFRFNGAIIKENERFRAAESEIPKSFRNTIVPLEALKDDFKVDGVSVVKLEYKLQQHGKSALWWDIVDKNGKVLNGKSLPKEKAEQFLQDLQK